MQVVLEGGACKFYRAPDWAIVLATPPSTRWVISTCAAENCKPKCEFCQHLEVLANRWLDLLYFNWNPIKLSFWFHMVFIESFSEYHKKCRGLYDFLMQKEPFFQSCCICFYILERRIDYIMQSGSGISPKLLSNIICFTHSHWGLDIFQA